MIYISGAITKIGVMKAMAIFNNTELKLKEQGYEVINPCRTNSTLPELDHDGYMVVSMAMLSLCDTIFMLEGLARFRWCKRGTAICIRTWI